MATHPPGVTRATRHSADRQRTAARRGTWAIVLGLLALVVLGYAAICGFMYVKQRDLLYFPQFTRVAPEQADFELAGAPVAEPGSPQATLRGWRLNPDRRHALLYFGGNAEAVHHNRETFREWFPDHTVYLLAYRGYGASDGTPSEKALVADALALHDFVATRHETVDVVGRSLGSGVAAQLAARRPVRRLALVTPFDSLAAVARAHYPWLPVDMLMHDRFDSARHLGGYSGEVLVVQAGNDEVIPAAHTLRLIEALPRSPQVVTLDDARHNGFDARPEYRHALRGFVAPPGGHDSTR